VRLGLVAAFCVLAATAGAGGVLFAAHEGGWFNGDARYQPPLIRASTPSVVISKPVLSHGFNPRHIFDLRSPGVVTVFSYFGKTPRTASIEEGSGFVVTRSGVVLTAAHVIVSSAGALPTPARAVYVQFSDGDRIPAQIVGWDPYDDVGVLLVMPSAHRLEPVPLGTSSGVATGQPVAAIGAALGVETSLSVGVVSGTGRTIPSLTAAYSLYDAIQTDAPINRGSSGGPLLDAKGRAIGINAQIRSSLESGFEGVAFAVPIDAAKRSMAQLLAYGRVDYAYIGLQTEDLTPQIARAFGYPAKHGALIDSVARNGPAAKAGLQPGHYTVLFQQQRITVGGDAIVAIDGTPVANSDDVAKLIAERMVPGEAAWLTILRKGKTLVIPVTLASRPR
jgi:2-alkenal reductase